MDNYTIICADEIGDVYADSDVPGEFRQLTEALGAQQLGITFIRVPPHSDFEQGTGHYHDKIEEVYIITKGTLTMRFGNKVEKVRAGSAVRVTPHLPRSHRNEGREPVEMWAISRQLSYADANKIDDFWEASLHARQSRASKLALFARHLRQPLRYKRTY